MAGILCDHTVCTGECILCLVEWNSMFLLILSVLLSNMLSRKRKKGNIIKHIFIGFHLLTLSFIDQPTSIRNSPVVDTRFRSRSNAIFSQFLFNVESLFKYHISNRFITFLSSLIHPHKHWHISINVVINCDLFFVLVKTM